MIPERARLALLVLFCAQFPLLDLALRRGRAVESVASLAAAAATLQSVCLWLCLAALARRRPARALAALLAGFALATQALFFLRFGQWIDAQVIRSALLSFHDVAPAVRAELPRLAAVTLALAALEYLWLGAASRALGKPGLRPIATTLLAGAALVPFSLAGQGPPDVRLGAALLAPLAPSISHAGTVSTQAVSLPPLPPRLPRLPGSASLPNVVLIVTESVRADEYCSAPTDTCPTAPRVNALLPDRIGLPEMRSLASYTAVSMAVLSTGRAQDIPRAELMSSPTVFDAIKAIDTGGAPPFTAFWSSHYAPVFHRDDPRHNIDSFVTHETFFGPDDAEDGDVHLADYALRRLPELPSPFFLVLHFHDTHLLYSFDEQDAPFSPWSRKVRWETMPELKNAYRNAIHFQDRQIARVMKALRDHPRFSHTFVLFTSDHGESFGEHGQIHHGQDLLDEQIHVPGWVTFGTDALAPDQAAALRANAARMLTHLDVAPTILDLFGVLDAYGLAPHVRKMGGQSLLRPMAPPAAAAITNCTEEFTCPWSTWGLLREGRKLEAQPWDFGWNCHRLGGGAELKLPLDEEGCRDLVRLSRAHFPKLPNGADNRE